MSRDKTTKQTNAKTPGPESIPLLSCPFCGSNDLTESDEPSQADEKRLHRVYCMDCRAMGPIEYTRTHGRESWNTRKRETDLINSVPTTWLDPLLTGKDKVVGNPPFECPDIERLLKAIRQRMEETR